MSWAFPRPFGAIPWRKAAHGADEGGSQEAMPQWVSSAWSLTAMVEGDWPLTVPQAPCRWPCSHNSQGGCAAVTSGSQRKHWRVAQVLKRCTQWCLIGELERTPGWPAVTATVTTCLSACPRVPQKQFTRHPDAVLHAEVRREPLPQPHSSCLSDQQGEARFADMAGPWGSFWAWSRREELVPSQVVGIPGPLAYLPHGNPELLRDHRNPHPLWEQRGSRTCHPNLSPRRHSDGVCLAEGPAPLWMGRASKSFRFYRCQNLLPQTQWLKQHYSLMFWRPDIVQGPPRQPRALPAGLPVLKPLSCLSLSCQDQGPDSDTGWATPGASSRALITGAWSPWPGRSQGLGCGHLWEAIALPTPEAKEVCASWEADRCCPGNYLRPLPQSPGPGGGACRPSSSIQMGWQTKEWRRSPRCFCLFWAEGQIVFWARALLSVLWKCGHQQQPFRPPCQNPFPIFNNCA